MSKETKTWSVWVDGFEMNAYKLTYEEATKLHDELLCEDEYFNSEIFVEETYKGEE